MNFIYHIKILKAGAEQLPKSEFLKFLVNHYFAKKNRWSKPKLLIFHPKKLNKTPIILREGTADKEVFLDMLAFERYMPEQNIKSIKTIFDLGANIGITSAHLVTRFPFSRILAVEANKQNYFLAKKNTLFKKNQIEILHGAVWHYNGVVSIAGEREDSFKVTKEKSNFKKTKSYTIKALMDQFKCSKIDLMKMDIEGAEEQVILLDKPGWLKKVRFLLLEIHKSSLFNPICKKLRNYGFTVKKSKNHWSGIYAYQKN